MARADVTMGLVVALTGGIASGKSTAAARFAALGAPVFDADLVARQLVESGSPALAEIANVFGRSMLLADGSLDRQAMRERVFADSAERAKLEQILHPRVRAVLVDSAQQCKAPYCVLVIPLLAEVRAAYTFVDRVLVLDVSPGVQVERLMNRDRVAAETAQQVIAIQASRARRLAMADDVIDNDGPPARMQPPLERLHAIYLAAGAARKQPVKPG